MKTLISAAIALMFCNFAQAELRIIGVKLVQDENQAVTASIFSAVKSENVNSISIDEAASILSKATGWGSSVIVGIEAHRVPLSQYLPILKSISENPWLDLGFVEGQKPNFIFENIKKEIEQGAAANP